MANMDTRNAGKPYNEAAFQLPDLVSWFLKSEKIYQSNLQSYSKHFIDPVTLELKKERKKEKGKKKARRGKKKKKKRWMARRDRCLHSHPSSQVVKFKVIKCEDMAPVFLNIANLIEATDQIVERLEGANMNADPYASTAACVPMY
jgi:hypothetical protein